MAGLLQRIASKTVTVADSAIAAFYRPGSLAPASVQMLSQPVKVTHPLPVNYDEKDAVHFNKWNNYHTRELRIDAFSDVNVSREGVVFRKMAVSPLSLVHPVFGKKFGLRYLLSQKKVRAAEGKGTHVLAFDHWSPGNYYHWLMDTLPRLYLLRGELASHTLLLPDHAPRFITETLKTFPAAGYELVEKKRPVHTPKLLLPGYTANTGEHHPGILKPLRDELAGTHLLVNKTFPEKIYASRGRQKVRRVANEEEVISLVKERGFTVVYFEEHSFAEQLSMMRNAKLFISSHGANMTNTWFMPRGARVFELNRDRDPNCCYWSLASAMELKYYYQLCRMVNHDDLLVDTDKFKKELDLFLE